MKTIRQKTLPEALGDYARRETARFHMPGHKGFGIPMPDAIARWDVTELPGTDDLHNPSGPIALTQQAYAKAYGARDCFLLVNGSTAGVLGMLLSIGANKRVLLARNCHRSAISGAVLADHAVEFLCPEPDGMITPAAVDAALTKKSADAVLLVSPDYAGRCADIAGVAAAAHAHGALLLLDAAHGAHFPFSQALPSLCAQTVDMFCVSAHKTLNAFTQAALLFTGRNCPLARTHIQRMLSLVQSSSPSYPLMVSLDWALHTARGWDAHLARMAVQRRRIAAVNGLCVQSPADASPARGLFAIDPARLVVDVRGRGISGMAAYRDLVGKGVVAEMADADRVVFITTPQDPDAWYDRLYEGLCTLPYGTARRAAHAQEDSSLPERVLSLREAVLAQAEFIPLSASAGRVAAVAAGPYPPGVARIFPGERIRQADVEALLLQQAEGCTLFGVEEKNKLGVVR